MTTNNYIANYKYDEPNGVDSIKSGYTQNDYKPIDYPYKGVAPELDTLKSITKTNFDTINKGVEKDNINTFLTTEDFRPHNKNIDL